MKPIHVNGIPQIVPGRSYDDTPGVDAPSVDATDSAIDLAEEFGIDLSTVEGSGAGGRVLKSDVAALITDDD